MRSAPRNPLSRRLARGVSGPLALFVTATLAASLAAPAAAQTQEAAKRKKVTGYYQMPFPCGQEWKGTTRSSHSPSIRAIDWNRPDDDGDEVVASAAGTVTVANKTGKTGYGRMVQITHLNGESTVYGHLSNVVVSVGQTVDQGVAIGNVGSTGNSTGPHLHFEEKLGSVVSSAIFAGQKFVYGSTQASRNCVDVPLAANMVGTAAAELVVFRRNRQATFAINQPGGGAPVVVPFGQSTDDPVLGDWDGDGTANVAVRRPSESTFYLSGPNGATTVLFGIPADRPVAGDWDGDDRTDIGVWRSSAATFFLRAPDGAVSAVALGDANDLPVTGDWNGDGYTDVGVYDVATATYTLRVLSGGVAWVATIPFGNPGDLPVVGDWDGNGTTDLGVWRPATGTFMSRQAPDARMAARNVTAVQFGRPRR